MSACFECIVGSAGDVLRRLQRLLFPHSNDAREAKGLLAADEKRELRKEVQSAEKEAFRELLNQDGGESLEWLNFLIEKLWPHIASYAEGIIRGLEEKIQQAVPVGISFTKVSLGKEPLRLGPVTYSTTGCYYDGRYDEEGGVELHIGLDYHSDCEIVLATKIASVGAACLDIAGTLAVRFRPLHGEAPPFFGGVEVLFTNPPAVDLDFKGIGNLADMPGIYGVVRRCIDDAIAGVMVMPNRITTQIIDSDKVDLARLKNPKPEGILRVRVVRAEKLAAADVGMFQASSSDPYVQIKVGSQHWMTPTIRKTLDPVWTKDNVHDFIVHSSKQSVFIDVLDWDKFSRDDPLGSVMVHEQGKSKRVTVKELAKHMFHGPTAFGLYAANDTEDPPPEDSRLILEVEWLRMVHPLAGPPWSSEDDASKYVLTLKIDECKNMPDHGLNAPYAVRCSIKGAGSSEESKPGWSKWSNTMTARGLESIRKLFDENVPTDIIAHVVDTEEALIKELRAYTISSFRGRESDADKMKDDAAWMQKISTARQTREVATNPQFEEVLLLTSATKDMFVVVEVLDDPKKRPRVGRGSDGVVARFERRLGLHEVVDGPFQLLDPTGQRPLPGNATLHGTFTLWRLEKASSCYKFKAVSHMVGMAALAHNRHTEAEATEPIRQTAGLPAPGPSRAMQALRSEEQPGLGQPLFQSETSSTSSAGRVRKRDKFFNKVASIFQPLETQGPTGLSANPCGACVMPSAVCEPTLARGRGVPVMEELVDLVEGSTGKDVLFALGLLRSSRDWTSARHIYRRKHGGAGGAKPGKGRGDLVAALELELRSGEDRAKAARILRAHGIGSGQWPPPGGSALPP